MTKKQSKDWKLFKGIWISPDPVLPGVWQRREGGHFVRARAKASTTGRTIEIVKVLTNADAATAFKWLKDEQMRVRAGVDSAPVLKQRFNEFAARCFEHKVKIGEIRSAKGRHKWGGTLEHLIEGTHGKKAEKFVKGFGDFFLHKLHSSHVEAWKEGIAELIAAGDYAPTTANSWLAILKVILKAARRELSLPYVATDGIKSFDTSEHDTYSDEEPNSLAPEEVGYFLAKFRVLYPAHFAMVDLGMVTGLRPSSLRPLRRRGPEADIDWETGRLRVRRSHSLGEEVMRTTKQKRRYTITLPMEVIDVLRWHVDTQLTTPEQKESDLLFPAVNGKFRAPSVLNKPLEAVALELGLKKKITQRALRRTFNDLARAAQVNDIVTRSISGHLTERMQQHYSSVNAGEQRDALTKVVHLFGLAPKALPAPSGEGGGEEPLPSGEGSKKAG